MYCLADDESIWYVYIIYSHRSLGHYTYPPKENSYQIGNHMSANTTKENRIINKTVTYYFIFHGCDRYRTCFLPVMA